MTTRKRRGTAGFTLIELLVVVLIIGILAAMAIPQYFKVVERSRLSESYGYASAVRSAQERYMAKAGNYTSDLTQLDINMTTMKSYSSAVTLVATCASGGPGYNIDMTRTGVVAARYTGYIMRYDRCSDSYYFTNCTNCTADLQ